MWDRAWRWAYPRLPLLTFAAVYGFTCYVGILALLLSAKFRALYFIFAGADVPDLLWRDVLIVLALATMAPLLVWLGYEIAIRRLRGWRPAALDGAIEAGAPAAVWIGRAAFVVSAAFALRSLVRAGGLEHTLSAWLDYNTYVYTRWRFVDTLGFFEFVNLYMMLPLWAAYLVLVDRRWVVKAFAPAAVFALQYPLASRKVLITSAILIATAAYAYARFGSSPRVPTPARRHVNMLFVAPACLYLLYLGLTLQTVIRVDSAPFKTIAAFVPEKQIEEARRRAAFRIRRRQLHPESMLDRIAVPADLSSQYTDLIKNRTQAVVLYTLLSSFTRTSISAVVYPVVFPEWHPYYHLDLGLDILRVGEMPDDNSVVYRFLWPLHHRGQIGAPFQIVLYSQGGMWVAFVGAFLVGLLLAACWHCVSSVQPGVITSLLASLTITFSAFLAIDSVRNSVVVSYGVLWGVLAMGAAAVLVRLLGAGRRQAFAAA